MDPLPMAPASCSLDESGLSAQLDRYRAVGAGASVIRQTARTIVIQPADDVPDELIGELIAVERECCPFFGLDWDAARRRFTVSVATPEHEPALEAIAYALAVAT